MSTDEVMEETASKKLRSSVAKQNVENLTENIKKNIVSNTDSKKSIQSIMDYDAPVSIFHIIITK